MISTLRDENAMLAKQILIGMRQRRTFNLLDAAACLGDPSEELVRRKAQYLLTVMDREKILRRIRGHADEKLPYFRGGPVYEMLMPIVFEGVQ